MADKWHKQPLEAIQQRAREDLTTVSWFLDDFNPDMAGNYAIQQDAALVFLQSDSGENYITVDGNVGDRYVIVQLALCHLYSHSLTSWTWP